MRRLEACEAENKQLREALDVYVDDYDWLVTDD